MGKLHPQTQFVRMERLPAHAVDEAQARLDTIRAARRRKGQKYDEGGQARVWYVRVQSLF